MCGARSLFARGMSGAFSSLTHFGRLFWTKTMSFRTQPYSAMYVSKEDLFRSFLQASRMSCSLSFSLQRVSNRRRSRGGARAHPQYSLRSCFNLYSTLRVFWVLKVVRRRLTVAGMPSMGVYTSSGSFDMAGEVELAGVVSRSKGRISAFLRRL